ncbi:MAG: sialate O-acetylesterase [Bacteroidetes bacterium]|nr:sialate O-acetylesterase [Bacteroidota bacterium]
MVIKKNIFQIIARRCLFAFLFLVYILSAQAQLSKIKIACVGNSVTYGYGLKDPTISSYPSLLQQQLGANYEVENFGHSGVTLLRKGHNPYYKTKAFTDMLLFKPDIAVIHLGLNDTDPRNYPNYRDEFIPDYSWLIDTIQKVNPKVKVYICSLTPIFSGHPRFVSSTFDWYWDLQKRIKEVAAIHHVQMIDLNAALFNRPDLFPDQIHPTEEGAAILANTVYQNLSGNFGGLQLPDIFTNNMVLQRNEPIKIWGKANAGTVVQAKFSQLKKSVKATNDGTWEIVLPASPANSQPQILEISNEEKLIQFNNILIGDVWLCSGQSNMYFSVKESAEADSVLQKADEAIPLRLFKYKPFAETDGHVWTAEELQRANNLNFFSGSWQLNDKQNVAPFSAVALAFGSKIVKEEKVPIGLIEVAVGGSPLISWVSRLSLESSPLFVQAFKNWTKSDFIMQWCRERAALNMKEATNPLQRHSYEPSFNFEAGIAKIAPFPIKGIIWYQGESDAENAELFEKLFPQFVQDWRKQWNKNLPFYYVQLSSIERPSWNYFRNAQRRMLSIVPNSGMAVSSDLGNKTDVHPKRKAPVGERLARLALKNTYHKNITASGPMFLSAKKIGNQIELIFSNSFGLKTTDNMSLRGFELLTNQGVFVPVSAIIKNDKVYIDIPKNIQVQKVAYAWQPFTTANLVNKENLPASTFIENIK